MEKITVIVSVERKTNKSEVEIEMEMEMENCTYDVFSERLVRASFLRIFVTLFHMNRL